MPEAPAPPQEAPLSSEQTNVDPKMTASLETDVGEPAPEPENNNAEPDQPAQPHNGQVNQEHAFSLVTEIDNPRYEIFETLTDLSKIRHYTPSLVKLEKLTDGNFGVGTKWEETRRFMWFLRATSTLECTEMTFPETMTVVFDDGCNHVSYKYSLATAGILNTRVTVDAECNLRRKGKLVPSARLARMMMDFDGNFLERLKEYMSNMSKKRMEALNGSSPQNHHKEEEQNPQEPEEAPDKDPEDNGLDSGAENGQENSGKEKMEEDGEDDDDDGPEWESDKKAGSWWPCTQQ